MNKTCWLLAAGVSCFVQLPVLAHEGVKDPAVLARMDSMKEIGKATKFLGAMAKGEARFDPLKARQSLALISDEARRTPELFAGANDDPKSKGDPAIWEDFADFRRKSKELERIAARSANELSVVDELSAALRDIGAACRACHEAYRKP
ncbi:MAG: cytochrome c [Silicimonas sp.]|nr:cytochrome c [Silicimonas sp.]